MMYGKRRVVLRKPTPSGRQLVVICGSDAPSAIHPGKHAGTYWPIGLWHKEDGLFYANVKADPFSGTEYLTRTPSFSTKQALRQFILEKHAL